MRRDAKTDANQAAIVEALRAVGCKVKCTHRIGGFVDIVVWSPFTKQIHLIEIKVPGGKLTPAEARFHAEWKEAAALGQLSIEESIDDALDAVGAFPF